jgi:hypothetical protein
MLQRYVLTCGRSVTAFWRPLKVGARGKGPARPTQRPALHIGLMDMVTDARTTKLGTEGEDMYKAASKHTFI